MKALEINSNFGNPYNDIGSYLMKLNRNDEAIEWLKKAIEAPNYNTRHFPYYSLGKIFEQSGDWKKAMVYYDNALTVKPDFIAAKNALFRVSSLLN